MCYGVEYDQKAERCRGGGRGREGKVSDFVFFFFRSAHSFVCRPPSSSSLPAAAFVAAFPHRSLSPDPAAAEFVFMEKPKSTRPRGGRRAADNGPVVPAASTTDGPVASRKDEEKAQREEEDSSAALPEAKRPRIDSMQVVRLNVGGQRFETTCVFVIGHTAAC